MDDHLSNEDYAAVRNFARDPRRTTWSTIDGPRNAEVNMRAPQHSTLEEIEQRIFKAMHGIDGITNLLNDHADRVHGPVPEMGNDAFMATDAPPGQISRIFMALEGLDGAVERIAQASGRNTTIA